MGDNQNRCYPIPLGGVTYMVLINLKQRVIQTLLRP